MTDQELAKCLRQLLGKALAVTAGTRTVMETRYYNLLREQSSAKKQSAPVRRRSKPAAPMSDPDDSDDDVVEPEEEDVDNEETETVEAGSNYTALLSGNESDVDETPVKRRKRTRQATVAPTHSGHGKLICFFLLLAIAVGIYFALLQVRMYS